MDAGFPQHRQDRLESRVDGGQGLQRLARLCHDGLGAACVGIEEHVQRGLRAVKQPATVSQCLALAAQGVEFPRLHIQCLELRSLEFQQLEPGLKVRVGLLEIAKFPGQRPPFVVGRFRVSSLDLEAAEIIEQVPLDSELAK